MSYLPHSELVKLCRDYDSLSAISPRVILATASAFGSEGPLASRVGFDAVGQAMSGTVHLTGTPDQPYRAQVNYVDFGTALHSAFGIMLALRTREATDRKSVVQGKSGSVRVALGGRRLIKKIKKYKNGKNKSKY